MNMLSFPPPPAGMAMPELRTEVRAFLREQLGDDFAPEQRAQ